MPPDESRQALSNALIGALAVMAVLAVVRALLSWSQLALLGDLGAGLPVTEAEINASDARDALIALLFGLGSIATAVVWCVWQTRTHHRVKALGAQHMVFGPNAWGWFFCPLLNLWRPFHVVSELWQDADRKSDDMETPIVFKLWWGAWIAGTIALRAGNKLSSRAEEIDMLVTATRFTLIGSVASIAAALAAIQVIRAISQRLHIASAR